MGLSAYFRDTETTPSPRTPATTRAGPPDTVIRVEGRDHVFAQLLGYYISPNPTRIRQWETARQLLLLGKRYQFTNLPRLIVPYIYTITVDDSWATFVFASQHDFSALGGSEASGQRCLLARSDHLHLGTRATQGCSTQVYARPPPVHGGWQVRVRYQGEFGVLLVACLLPIPRTIRLCAVAHVTPVGSVPHACRLILPQAYRTSPAIHLAGDSPDIARLLDLVISPTPKHFSRWREVQPVLDLAARYHFDNFPVKVVPLVSNCLMHDAWSVFVFASQHNVPSLAKHAIGHFPQDSCQFWKKSTNIETLEPLWFVDVASTYSVALIQTMVKNTIDNRGNLKVNWSGVAADFKVD